MPSLVRANKRETTRPSGARVPAWLAVVMLVPGLAPAPAAGAEPEECTPWIRVASVDGDPPAAVAPPQGSTDRETVAVELDYGFDGSACDEALNARPRLSGASVDPALSHMDEPYRVEVYYQDPDGDPPASIQASMLGRVVDLTPKPPVTTNARVGIRYRGEFLGPHPLGQHPMQFTASDGITAAEPLNLDGPEVVRPIVGAVRAPNPTGRLFINPVANGPQLVPPLEVLPPWGGASPRANGMTSYAFALDPRFDRPGNGFRVNQAFALNLVRDPSFEAPPGAASLYELEGPGATLAAAARSGQQAVNLAAPGIPAGDLVGLLRVRPDADVALAQLDTVDGWALRPNGLPASPAPPEFRIEFFLDVDLDGTADACARVSMVPPGAPSWTRFVLTGSSTVRMLGPDCQPVPAAPEVSMSFLEARRHSTFGLARVLHVHYALRMPPGEGSAPDSWPAGHELFLDDLTLMQAVPATVADFDVCFYRALGVGPDATLSPLSCTSDTGPNSGALPPGTTHVNTWAHDFSTNPVSFAASVPQPASARFQVVRAGVGLPAPPPLEPAEPIVRAWIDADADGLVDPGERVVAEARVDPRAGPGRLGAFEVPLGPEDGITRVAFELVAGSPEDPLRAVGSQSIQHFVNDPPSAELDVDRVRHPARSYVFHISGTDPDEATATGQQLGGLRAWRLTLSDGTTYEGDWAPPTVEHRFQRPGVYEAHLQITDAAGAADSADATIRASPRP